MYATDNSNTAYSKQPDSPDVGTRMDVVRHRLSVAFVRQWRKKRKS